MINLWKKENLNLLSEYPKEVFKNVINTMNILGESYSYDREVTDDGGYICILQSIEEVDYFKENILKGIVEEFSDAIYESENITYNSTLYLPSSDYAITVITKNEFTDKLLK